MLDVLQPLSSVPIVFVDTETTGLTPAKHRIWELCAQRIEQRDGQPYGWQIDTLINPAIQLDEDHHFRRPEGVTGELLRAALPWSAWAPRVADIFRGALVVAHNAPFDVRFIEMEMRQAGHPSPIEAVVCTQQLARKLLRGHKSYALEALAWALSLRVQGTPHRAGVDVAVMAQLFNNHLLPLLEGVQVHQLIRYTNMEDHSPALREAS